MGQWKITQFLTALPVGNLSQKDSDSLIGKSLNLSTDTISINADVLTPDDRSCPIDHANSSWITENAFDYFVTDNGYRLSVSDVKSLGLSSPFWHLSSFCMDVFTRSNPNKLILFFGSNFFEATRVKQ